MNSLFFFFLLFLAVSFLCAVLIVAATIISGRSVKKMAQQHPTIYGDEVLAKNYRVKTPPHDAALGTESKQVMAP